MALIKKDTGRKQTVILLSVFGGLAVAAGVYFLFFANVSSTKDISDSSIQAIQKETKDLQILNTTLGPDLDRVYADPRFQEMRQYGSLPVDEGIVGRSNPFAPLTP